MKPAQITELFANIKKTFVSFFSILMFVALGVSIFLGISWSGPALRNAADNEFDEGTFHDFQVQYLYGLADSELEQLAALDGVTDVEPARQSFQTLVGSGNTDLTVKVQTMPERIDMLTMVEGQLPKAANEIALNEIAAKELGYAVGDTIVFEPDPEGASEEESIDLALGLGDAGAGVAAGDGASTPTESGADAAAASTEAASITSSGNDDGMKYLNGAEYKVTALVKSPEYIAKEPATYGVSNSPSGGVDLLAWVPASAFDASAYQNGYPIVNITCKELAGLGTFTDDYDKKSSALEKSIDELCTPLSEARFDGLFGQIQAKIAEAEKQLEDAKRQIADGEKQLAEGRAELESKKAEGEAALAEAYELLMGYEATRQEGEAALVQARAAIAEGEQALATVDEGEAAVWSFVNDASGFKAEQDSLLASGQITQAEHDANLDAYGAGVAAELQPYADLVGMTVPAVDHVTFDMGIRMATELANNLEGIPVVIDGEAHTIASARAKLADGRQQLAAAEAEYNQKVAELDAGWAEYNAGKEERDKLIAEGEAKLAEGERKVAEAKRLVAENEPKLQKAKEKFGAMENSKLAVLSRDYNAGTIEISTFSGVTSRLSLSMAALFIIMGLLVTYSAVSRLIHEQVTQIGTKKALGFRSREITLSFLLYSGLAVIVGTVVGAIIGFVAVEGIIGNALGDMFTFGNYPGHFGIGLFIAVSLLELALVLGATYLACRGILKKHAVELLRGNKPFSGKARFYEKWEFWDKLPLFTQTIVSNCVNDRRRMFSTVVGVAGCTALIVTALTLSNDVLKSYDRHYDNVYGFNAITYVDTSVDGAADEVERAIEAQGVSATPIVRKILILDQPDGDRGTMRIIVPAKPDEFAGEYHVNPVSGNEFDPSSDGVWVSQAYAKHFGAKVGDTLKFEDTNGVQYEAPIRGINEFWLTYHEVVMGRDYYESLFGNDSFEPNVVLADTGDIEVSDIGKALENVEGFSSIADDKTYQHLNFETFSTVSNAVVLIYLILAILMAIVVLLNLNAMFVEEKKRELIVLMINGFSVKDAQRYVSNDSIVLTAIGIILGIIVGCIMGSITVGSIEPSTASFVSDIDARAVIAGIVGSSVLAFVMGKISLRRIPNMNLTDINKA